MIARYYYGTTIIKKGDTYDAYHAQLHDAITLINNIFF
jgi:hypothetical protein